MHRERSPHRTDLKRGSKKRVAPGVYLRAGRYLVTYMDVDGSERLKTTEARNLTEAKAVRESMRVKVRSGEAVAPTKATLDDVAQEFFSTFESLVSAGEKSERTLALYQQRYRTHLQRSLGRLEVQAVRAEHVARLLADLRKAELASWTVKGILTLLGSILNHAVSRGLIVETPLKRLSRTERPQGKSRSQARALTDEECSALIEHAIPTYRPIVALVAFTGLRQSEALGLRWQDVDFENNLIRVRYQLSRSRPARLVPLKTLGSVREIYVLPPLAAMLRKRKLATPYSQPTDFVFATQTGQPFYYRNVSARGLAKAADRAGLNREGVDRLSFHDLRHTAISRWIALGIDVVEVSSAAGHADPSITLKVYAKQFKDARRRDEVRDALEAGTRIAL